MAPVENMLSEQQASRNQDDDCGSDNNMNNLECKDAVMIEDSFRGLTLDGRTSTGPCQPNSSKDRTLENLTRQIRGLKIESQVTVKAALIVKVKSENLQTNEKSEDLKAKVKTEVIKATTPITVVKTENLKPCQSFKSETKLELKNCKREPSNAEPCLGELVSRGPDKHRGKDVYYRPYPSTLSSSPESVGDPSSPEGSPQSVSDHRRQSGGSYTICRQPPGKMEVQEQVWREPVVGKVQNELAKYRQKSGGAVEVLPSSEISIPSNHQQFIERAQSSCYPNSPSSQYLSSPSIDFSSSCSPFGSLVPSPSQTYLSAVGSPNLYRDGPSLSSPESVVAYSPVPESISSPYPSSPSQPCLNIAGSVCLSDQMDDICLTPQLTDHLSQSQIVPDGQEDLFVNIMEELEEFIHEGTGDQPASPEMVKEKLNEIMNVQDQTASESNVDHLFATYPTTAGLPASPTTTVPMSVTVLATQQPKITVSPSSSLNRASSNFLSNNHPVLTNMLIQSHPGSGPPRTRVNVVNTSEVLIPCTVNPGSAQIVPVVQIFAAPTSPPVSAVGRPRSRRSSSPRKIVPRLIAPKPRPIPSPPTTSTSSPVKVDAVCNPLVTRTTREELHAKLLKPFDDATRLKLHQAVQAIPEVQLVKKDANRGDTAAHMAITQKKTLLSVNLIDRYVQTSASNLNIENYLGHTLLFCAAVTHQASLVEYLLLSGANPNQQVITYGTTLVHYLSERGARFTGVLDKLCSFPGVDLNKHSCEGRTPLLCAIESHGRDMPVDSNSTDIIDAGPVISTLLRYGASLAVPCRCSGKTALHLAVQMKNFALAQLLCSNYAGIREVVNLQAFDGNTCLHYAAGMSGWPVPDQLRMAKLLLAHGAIITETNNESKIPADLVERDRKELKKLLKPAGGRRGSST